MRAVMIIGTLCTWFLGAELVGGQAAAARSEAKPGRVECKKLALEKRELDKAGMAAYLAKSPESVAAERGRSFVDRVRHYITLTETVLFKCPRYVLNANIGRSKTSSAIPPLPVKGPFKARARKPRRPLVPLPVKRQSGHLRENLSTA